jgi:hypothetical protein
VVPNATMSNFQSQEFTFSGELLSGATVGTVIVNNQAENQTFLYNFPDNAYGPGFEIDSNTGVIIINNPENITSGINQFRVKITDSSDPEMSYEGSIIIHVSKESLTNSSILKEGIPEITSDQLEVVLWPNPSPDGIFRLSIKDTESVNEIQAIDFSGKIIQSFISESSDNIVIDLSSQPKGMYILKIQSGKKLKNLKAIIN